MNATKTMTSFAIAAIALSAAVFNAPMADAQSGAKTPVKIAQADTKTEAAPAKSESKKATKVSKKASKASKKAAKAPESKEAKPAETTK